MSQAFFAALESVPEASRAAVAKAAQVMIRDEIKARREKDKAAAAKERLLPQTARERAKKASMKPSAVAAKTAPAKRTARS